MPAAIAELPGWARAMLEQGRVARLGLLDDAQRPRVLPVAYVLHADSLWSAVDRKPKRRAGEELARVRYLRSHPRVALTVDHYEDDWTALAWVQALGEALVLPVDQEPDVIAALAAKYEPYRLQPPPGPLVRLSPERFICWRASD